MTDIKTAYLNMQFARLSQALGANDGPLSAAIVGEITAQFPVEGRNLTRHLVEAGFKRAIEQGRWDVVHEALGLG